MGAEDILELTARLTRHHGELARAHDPQAFLRAVAGALAPFGPDHIDLAYVHPGADGQPERFEVVESWAEGGLAASPIVGGSFAVRDFAFARRMLRSNEPQLLPELAREPELAEAMTAAGRRLASGLVLPLYSERQAAWQGVCGVYWRAPHAFAAVERGLYPLLMHMAAEALASKRTLRALRESLQRGEDLLRRTEATLRETEAQKATLGVLLDNLPLGVAVVNGELGVRELVNRRGVELLDGHGEGGPEVRAAESLVFVPGEATPLSLEQMPHVVTLATGETVTRELEFERHPGERVLFEVSSSLLRYPGDPARRVVLLYQDITDLRRRELERLRAQEELLRAQELALAERSTPLIPIRDDLLVMPIIGAIDATRGHQIVDTLVHLGGASGVRAAIVDITGVRELDTAAASTLVAAARALRLRGVQPVLTGIQPDVAATLVGLGVDLAGIATYGTLQDAVARVGAR
jgi:anti-anti-sigma regulatory factor/PAS domain-containing protein